MQFNETRGAGLGTRQLGAKWPLEFAKRRKSRTRAGGRRHSVRVPTDARIDTRDS